MGKKKKKTRFKKIKFVCDMCSTPCKLSFKIPVEDEPLLSALVYCPSDGPAEWRRIK